MAPSILAAIFISDSRGLLPALPSTATTLLQSLLISSLIYYSTFRLVFMLLSPLVQQSEYVTPVPTASPVALSHWGKAKSPTCCSALPHLLLMIL